MSYLFEMKGKELGKVADKYLGSIEKYCRRIPGTFTIEDIHDLRVDYKRLRALLRLCKEERRNRELEMPENLREVYKAAGRVRDHQLFLARIVLIAKVKYALPQFTRCLQQRLFSEKENLVKKIEKVEWNKTRKAIHSALPATLHESAIKQFVNRKVAAIHIFQLVAEREEDLHEVRKNLKDQVHVSRTFTQDLAIPFPFPAWQNEKSILDMAEKLGDFNDECIVLSFLESSCIENISVEEKGNIDSWRNMQLQQVETVKKSLLQDVRKIRLNTYTTTVN